METARNPKKEFEEIINKHPELINPSIKALEEYIVRKDQLMKKCEDLPASQMAAMLTDLMHECFEKHTKNIKICS